MFQNTCLAWSKNGSPVAPMVKYPFKVHVWVAINISGKVGIHLFTENLDRHLYREILNNHLYNGADALLGHKWIFQQDNDPVMIEVFNVREGVEVVIRIMYLITNHGGLYT